jgi:hypothetical protein
VFKVYDGGIKLGDDLPYSGEAASCANSLPKPKPVVKGDGPSFVGRNPAQPDPLCVR